MNRFNETKAKLVLQDGTIFEGKGFGFPVNVSGEIVFNTGMVGYTETLTDPSYKGQILCFTYPSIGNYGVPSMDSLDEYGLPKYFESDRIQTNGIIVNNLSDVSSHWTCTKTLDQWMYDERIPGITNIDTRELTKKIRSHGVMNGKLVMDESEHPVVNRFDYDSHNFMPEVSITEPRFYGNKNNNFKVVLIDTGTKYSIIRNLLKLGFTVVRLPWDSTINEILSYNPAGVVISNGPGDPIICRETISTASKIIENAIPTLGICLGNQILALAGGAKTHKLKFGHRGQNKSCLDINSKITLITSQNHGYGVESDSLHDTEFEVWFKNIDDNTVEGIKHKNKPIIAVQFHPEASPGPDDCLYVFEKFKELVKKAGIVVS
ncbi:MAG TPA: glutamine-hydrolyzing carbamoyl-phosphate synthase small subunit [Candidatus Nitrosocosmicus sp.]|nr:glutamine-hydrolyzing carbamoyl-phosphate synthase small subunit [Candidatus Nitrosocosmicus sp.]